MNSQLAISPSTNAINCEAGHFSAEASFNIVVREGCCWRLSLLL